MVSLGITRSPTQDAEWIVTHQDCYELGLGLGDPRGTKTWTFAGGRMHPTGESESHRNKFDPSGSNDNTLFMNKKKEKKSSKQQTTPKKKACQKKKY